MGVLFVIDYNSPLTEDYLTKGRSDRCPVVDMHAHMFNCYECNMVVDTPEKQLAHMDKSGVQLSLFCSHNVLAGGPDFYQGDLEVCRRFPERFRMYMGLCTAESDFSKDLSFMEKNDEVWGLKMHPSFFQAPLSDPRNDPYLAYAEERHLPVLAHTWHGNAVADEKEARKVLEKYNDLVFVAGHSFRGSFTAGPKLAEDYPNVVLELTAVLSQRGMLEAFIDAGLEDRIVFGVDAPWFSYEFGIGAILDAHLSDTQREKILWKNAVRILSQADIRPNNTLRFLTEMLKKSYRKQAHQLNSKCGI